MKISVNIQSYKRDNDVDTLKLFPDANVWVHTFEIGEYKKCNKGANIRLLPDKTRGNLPRVKNFILETERKNDAVVFLDDDMSAINCWEEKSIKVFKGKGLYAFLEKYTNMCMEWGFALWGINVNSDKQVYREYSPFSTLSYVSSSFACFLKKNELRYDERFPLKEDYDMTVQQFNRYRGLLRINKFFYVKKSAENTGGCALYRNIEKEREQIRLLQKKWGSRIVKVDSGNSRSHTTSKNRNKTIDINPIIYVPINGI